MEQSKINLRQSDKRRFRDKTLFFERGGGGGGNFPGHEFFRTLRLCVSSFGGQQLMQEFYNIKNRTYIEKALDVSHHGYPPFKIFFQQFCCAEIFLGIFQVHLHPHKSNGPSQNRKMIKEVPYVLKR